MIRKGAATPPSRNWRISAMPSRSGSIRSIVIKAKSYAAPWLSDSLPLEPNPPAAADRELFHELTGGFRVVLEDQDAAVPSRRGLSPVIATSLSSSPVVII